MKIYKIFFKKPQTTDFKKLFCIHSGRNFRSTLRLDSFSGTNKEPLDYLAKGRSIWAEEMTLGPKSKLPRAGRARRGWGAVWAPTCTHTDVFQKAPLGEI